MKVNQDYSKEGAIKNVKEWNPQLIYVLMTNNHVLNEEDISQIKK
jgi:hypothetical protein